MPGSATGVTRGKTLRAISHAFASSCVISPPCPRASTRPEPYFAGVAVPSPHTSLDLRLLLGLRCHLFNRSHGRTLQGSHFVAAPNNFMPRRRASGIFLTYLLWVTPMLEYRNNSLAANKHHR